MLTFILQNYVLKFRFNFTPVTVQYLNSTLISIALFTSQYIPTGDGFEDWKRAKKKPIYCFTAKPVSVSSTMREPHRTLRHLQRFIFLYKHVNALPTFVPRSEIRK